MGHSASFSFYPGKNLGAYGDAGAMTTNDPLIAEKARMIANHGQKGKHNHLIEGRNSRLDGLQAAILNAKLPYLKQWNEARLEKAKIYSELLRNSALILPTIPSDRVPVFHLYVVQLPEEANRNEIMENLKKAEIETAVHYPVALPFLHAYKANNHRAAEFPVAVSACNRILSLPIFPEITMEQQQYVADSLLKLLK